MNRRQFFMKPAMATAVTAIAASTPFKLLAEEGDLEFVTTIGRNHGHALALTMKDVILLMRELQVAATTDLDIKGRSRHPHTVNINFDDVVELLVKGKLSKVSSVDSGHSHQVEISLVL